MNSKPASTLFLAVCRGSASIQGKVFVPPPNWSAPSAHSVNLGRFVAFTALGAGIWNTVLAMLGFVLEKSVPEDKLIETVTHYSHEIGYSIAAIVVVVLAVVIISNRRKKKA